MRFSTRSSSAPGARTTPTLSPCSCPYVAEVPNATRGPGHLSRIDHAENLSQETYAFIAVIAIDGKTSLVRNEGCGGPNHIREHAVSALVEAHAATLPPEAGL